MSFWWLVRGVDQLGYGLRLGQLLPAGRDLAGLDVGDLSSAA